MNKKRLFIVIAVVLLLALLLIPVKLQFKDGGTVQYKALTYTVIRWVVFDPDTHEKSYITKVYFIPDNFKDINELEDPRKF